VQQRLNDIAEKFPRGCRRHNFRLDLLTAESHNNNLHTVRALSNYRGQDKDSVSVGATLLRLDTNLQSIHLDSTTENSKGTSLTDDFMLSKEDRERCEAISSHHQERQGRFKLSSVMHRNSARRVLPK